MPHRQLQSHEEPGLWPPSWPMGLTMLRLVLLPLFLYLVLADVGTGDQTSRRWAVGVFAVMAITDKLDGYLARKLNQTSKLGTILDPVADKLLIACAVIVLALPQVAPPGFRIPLLLVIIIYGKDLLVAFGALALLSSVGKVSITPRPLGKLGTFLQLSTVIAVLVAPDIAILRRDLAHGLTRALWWLTAGVTLASAGDYVIQGVKQLRASRRADERLATHGARMNTDVKN